MPTEYSELVHLFIDLRGRGISLSSVDLDILKSWENNGLSPTLIARVMFEIESECKLKSKHFPNTLIPISRKLNKVLLKMREA